jgi:hypothetical protein
MRYNFVIYQQEAVDIFLKVEDFWRKHPVDESLEDDVTIALEDTDTLTTPALTETTPPQ